jgi:hypothetical protein
VDWPSTRRLVVALRTPATHCRSIGTRSIDLLSCPREAWPLTGIRSDIGGPGRTASVPGPRRQPGSPTKMNAGAGSALSPRRTSKNSEFDDRPRGEWASAPEGSLAEWTRPAAVPRETNRTGADHLRWPATTERRPRQQRDGGASREHMNSPAPRPDSARQSGSRDHESRRTFPVDRRCGGSAASTSPACWNSHVSARRTRRMPHRRR